jgi:peptidoglycan/xylan/chitin deacetylase (PgdA/CDA1 family)
MGRSPSSKVLCRAGLVLGTMACAVLAACGGGATPAPSPEAHAVATPRAAPAVTLTADDRAVWTPRPADRSEIPVLLYHGIGAPTDFADAADSAYGLDRDDFAKQMALLAHAGYETISLEQFVRFARGEHVDLPPRPLLLTFDDARADSYTGADAVLRRLGFTAVMFVDAGAVDRGAAEYLTWDRLASMQASGRWEIQLHAGRGHHNIRYGPGARDVGPFYAYRARGETIEAWQRRVVADLEWGERRLVEHVPGYRPLAFAPPYGNFGQAATNDRRIPGLLESWLLRRYATIFTQDRDLIARTGEREPFGRLQITRRMTGGALHAALIATA